MYIYLGAVFISGDQGCFPLLGMGQGGGHLHKRNLRPNFRWIGGKQSSFCVCFFSVAFSSK